MSHNQTPPPSIWKENPLYAAAITAAGLLAILIPVYTEILLPTQMASAQFKIEELQKKISDISGELSNAKLNLVKEKEKLEVKKIEISKTTKKLNTEIKANEAHIEKLQLEIEKLKLGNIFAEGSSYPYTLDAVKIGQDIENVQLAFEDAEIVKSEYYDYWSGTTNHPFFKSVVFYFNEKNKKIYQISYNADYLTSSNLIKEEFLQRNLVSRFGEPLTVLPKHYIWKSDSNLNIFKDTDHSFILAGEGVIPGGWNVPITKFYERAKENISE